MAEVVDLFAALPDRVLDTRLTTLRRAFGLRPFRIGEIAAVLGIDVMQATELCQGGLRDDLSEIVMADGCYRLTPVPPVKAAMSRWRQLYLPTMRSLGEFTALDLARAAWIPVATSVFLCSEFHKAGLLVRPYFRTEEHHATYAVKRRKVILNAPQEHEVRYPRRKIIWRKEPVRLPAHLMVALVYPGP